MGSCPRLCTIRVVKLTTIICACNEVTTCAAKSLLVYTTRLQSYKGGHLFAVANNHSATTSLFIFTSAKMGGSLQRQKSLQLSPVFVATSQSLDFGIR